MLLQVQYRYTCITYHLQRMRFSKMGGSGRVVAKSQEKKNIVKNGPLPLCPGPAAIFTGRRNKDHEPCQVPRIECQQVQHGRFCSGITDGDDHRRTKRLPSTIAGPRLKRQSVGVVWIQRLYVGQFRLSVSATAMGGGDEEPSIAVVCTGRLQDVK